MWCACAILWYEVRTMDDWFAWRVNLKVRLTWLSTSLLNLDSRDGNFFRGGVSLESESCQTFEDRAISARQCMASLAQNPRWGNGTSRRSPHSRRLLSDGRSLLCTDLQSPVGSGASSISSKTSYVTPAQSTIAQHLSSLTKQQASFTFHPLFR